MTTETFYHLSYEVEPDGCVSFEQNTSGNIDRVYVHPAQLVHIVKTSGLMDCTDSGAQKTVAALLRRIRVLAKRIEELDHYLATHPDIMRGDFSLELALSATTVEIAQEYLADLDQVTGIPLVEAKHPQEAKKTSEATQPLQMSLEGSEA